MQFIRDGKNPFITGDGEQRRDMAHLEDVVSANIFAMDRLLGFGGEAFDVGTGDNISLNQIKDIANEYFPEVQFDYKDARVGDVLETKANISRFTEETFWKPQHQIEKGIRDCFQKLKIELGGSGEQD